MIRIFTFAAFVLAAAWGFAWLADRPGEMTILWQGQRVEMSLMVAASLFTAAFGIVLFSWWLVRTLWTSPQAVSRYFRARKRDRGYQALSTGLIAAGAGNALLAAKMAERSRSLISADQEPLIHLLEAQTALIQGRNDDARLKFEAMAEDPETRELGLRGLFMEARRLGAYEAAEHYAAQAVEKAPYLPWASQAVLEFRTRAGDFDEALKLLAKQKASGTTGGKDTTREKAVLLTARAQSRLDADPKAAREDALQALKLFPTLVPAATVAAKAYFRDDNLRRGAAVLEQVWKLEPHPELADAYISARGGDSALDRLKRAEKLEKLTPENPVALAAVAQAALDARLFDKAREKTAAALKKDPREGLLLLLADIEEAETGDQAKIRHFLSAAVRAPRDAAWVADGVVSPEWQPVSPVTGELGAFIWKAPFHQSEGKSEGEDIRLVLENYQSPAPPEPDLLDLDIERSVIASMSQRPEIPEKAMAGDSTGSNEKTGLPNATPAIKIEPPTAPTIVAKAVDGAAVVPFFGHAPDDPGVRKEKAAASKKKKPLF